MNAQAPEKETEKKLSASKNEREGGHRFHDKRPAQTRGEMTVVAAGEKR
jgi:hypothetical protein